VLNRPLAQAVAAAAGIDRTEDLHILQCSSSGATGAIILQAWVTGERFPRVVVKTPRYPRLRHAVRREWDAVNLLCRDEQLARLMPAPKAAFQQQGAEFFVYEGLPGQTMESQLRNRLFASRERMLERLAPQALAVALSLHQTCSMPGPPELVARDLVADLTWLEATVPSFPREVSSRARDAAGTIRASSDLLPHGRIHGDFSPHNVMLDSAAPGALVRLIDWEHTEPERPQHLDVFRFISTCAFLGRRGDARRDAFESMGAADNPLLDRLLRPWLIGMGAAAAARMDARLLQALWWHYLVHAARREHERLAKPVDYRDPELLRGLIAYAPRCVT
jgi:hypothetical protein